MSPLFANLFTVGCNGAVVQIVFKNQIEKDAAETEVVHVVTSMADAVELANVILGFAAKLPSPQTALPN